MFDRVTLRKAVAVATVVGTVLVLINQYDALFGGAEFRIVPALLTYCVPFVVFLAGNYSNKNNEL